MPDYRLAPSSTSTSSCIGRSSKRYGGGSCRATWRKPWTRPKSRRRTLLPSPPTKLARCLKPLAGTGSKRSTCSPCIRGCGKASCWRSGGRKLTSTPAHREALTVGRRCPHESLDAPARRDRPSGRLVARERPCVRHRGRHLAKPPQPHSAFVSSVARESRAAANPLPRPTPYVRHASAVEGRARQVCARASRALDHSHNARYLQPRLAADGQLDGGRYGRRFRAVNRCVAGAN